MGNGLMWVRFDRPDVLSEVTSEEITADLEDGGVADQYRLCERSEFNRYERERQAMEDTLAVIAANPKPRLTVRAESSIEQGGRLNAKV